ncbi:hypothetical protein E2C01_015505 [Portunus trituberculatus]|uniref:Uncharacterized protein n=1 Tax=Portunus trituberculatus TaxID=210409 RepID=A0A5B7DM17_PORTR|nr:hypothetical protein [Portunus trituberculatus]
MQPNVIQAPYTAATVTLLFMDPELYLVCLRRWYECNIGETFLLVLRVGFYINSSKLGSRIPSGGRGRLVVWGTSLEGKLRSPACSISEIPDQRGCFITCRLGILCVTLGMDGRSPRLVFDRIV